jgi:hypothetical protein
MFRFSRGPRGGPAATTGNPKVGHDRRDNHFRRSRYIKSVARIAIPFLVQVKALFQNSSPVKLTSIECDMESSRAGREFAAISEPGFPCRICFYVEFRMRTRG